MPIALGLLAAAAAVVAVLSISSPSQATVSERVVTVSRGVVQAIVSGSGNLEPARQLDVSFGTSGRITKVYVTEGDHVSKGDLLAKLDGASQRVAVAQAQAQLVGAQDTLTQVQSGTTSASETASTGTTIAVAAIATPSPTATPSQTPTPSPTPKPHATAIPSPSPGGSSSGGSTTSLESAQANVQSAELAVAEARDALDATTLRAPAAGTIASISNAAGDSVGSGSSSSSGSGSTGSGGAAASGSSSGGSSSSTGFIVLAQLSRLRMQVALSESDIGKVKVGQKATVTINAASGEQVGAHVSSIGVLSSSSSTGTSTAVSYPVTVTLDQNADGVRTGMSATADIVSAQASGLAVPNQALRGTTVTVDRNGQRSTQRVQTGVVGDSTTQVVSGLAAGDKVVITSTSAVAGSAASGQTQGPGGGGGLGGGPGGFRGGGGFGGGGLRRTG